MENSNPALEVIQKRIEASAEAKLKKDMQEDILSLLRKLPIETIINWLSSGGLKNQHPFGHALDHRWYGLYKIISEALLPDYIRDATTKFYDAVEQHLHTMPEEQLS